MKQFLVVIITPQECPYSVEVQPPQVVPTICDGLVQPICNIDSNFFKVLLEVRHPVKANTEVLCSFLKHKARVANEPVQMPVPKLLSLLRSCSTAFLAKVTAKTFRHPKDFL